MNGMNSMMYMYEAFKEEIQKVAEKVSQWNDEYTHCYLVADQWIRFNDGQGCSKAEWRAARDEMEYNLSPMAEAIDKPCMKTQVKQWQAAEDDFLAPEIGIVERFIGDPFSSPDEEEAWRDIEKKNNPVWQNPHDFGGVCVIHGVRYSVSEPCPMCVLANASAKEKVNLCPSCGGVSVSTHGKDCEKDDWIDEVLTPEIEKIRDCINRLMKVEKGR